MVSKDVFWPTNGQAGVFISKYFWTLGVSVKQQVVRLGMILAALQFAGEVRRSEHQMSSFHEDSKHEDIT
jgi:hypothetical protein